MTPYGVMNLLNNGPGNKYLTQGSVCSSRHFRAAGSRASESELLLTCPMPSRRTVVNPGQSKCTDWNLWFNVYMVFLARKLLKSVSRVSGYCCLSVFDFIRQIIIRTAQQWRIIGACFRLRTDIANLISFRVGKMCQLILQMKHLID